MENKFSEFTEPFILPVVYTALAVIIYLFIKKYFPKVTDKLKERYTLDPQDISTLNSDMKKLINIVFFIVLYLAIVNFPYIGEFFRKYIINILSYRVIDTEAIKLSLYSIIKGVLVFYILLLITKIVRKSIEIYLSYKAKEEELATTVDILVYHFSLIIISLIALSTMGITWKLLIPIAGALGIGIGFGIQDVVNNFISGFIILLGRTVKRGDWISVGDNFGKVVDIGVRTSTLKTLDNIDIIIPNSQLVSNQLINWSYVDPVVRIHVPVGVSYSSDVEKVRKTLIEVAKNTDFVLKNRKIEARFIEFGDNSLNFELLVWINVKRVPIYLARSELNYKIWHAFKENGIEIPFPQRDIWFKNELIIKKAKEKK